MLPTGSGSSSGQDVVGFGEVAEKLRRSTVVVHTSHAGGGGSGSGSGVIWSGDGQIITNAHVARATRARVETWDGRELAATVASRDSRRDLALLRVNFANAAPNFLAAIPADSSQVRPGELAIAIGNPLGFVGALTTGVIHAVAPVRGLGPHPWVQANVRLAPGNSGGPLADARGRVIGINTMVARGLALAIPSNAVRDFLSAGASDAWLGVTVHPVQIPRSKSAGSGAPSFGLVLLEVEPGSPASTASLMPGDILLGTEETRFASLADLSRALNGSASRLLRIEFLRGDYSRVRRVTIQLGAQGAQPNSVAA
jgi:serine protease Do